MCCYTAYFFIHFTVTYVSCKFCYWSHFFGWFIITYTVSSVQYMEHRCNFTPNFCTLGFR